MISRFLAYLDSVLVIFLSVYLGMCLIALPFLIVAAGIRFLLF